MPNTTDFPIDTAIKHRQTNTYDGPVNQIPAARTTPSHMSRNSPSANFSLYGPISVPTMALRLTSFWKAMQIYRPTHREWCIFIILRLKLMSSMGFLSNCSGTEKFDGTVRTGGVR